MEITDEMIDKGIAAWHRAIIDAPDELVPERRKRCIRAVLDAALAAAPASAAEPVPLDAFKAIEAESNQLRELCTKHRSKTEKLRQDIAFLLSVIHGLSEATGEHPSEDDAVILAEIEEEAGAPFTIDT